MLPLQLRPTRAGRRTASAHWHKEIGGWVPKQLLLLLLLLLLLMMMMMMMMMTGMQQGHALLMPHSNLSWKTKSHKREVRLEASLRQSGGCR